MTNLRKMMLEELERRNYTQSTTATLDELGVTIHFVKENETISPDSRSSEQFTHGIKV